MPTITKKLINDTVEVIDNILYQDCVFKNCRLIYRGGLIPSFDKCEFTACQFTLDDAAYRTIMFLSTIYNGMNGAPGVSGKDIVDTFIDVIRKPQT